MAYLPKLAEVTLRGYSTYNLFGYYWPYKVPLLHIVYFIQRVCLQVFAAVSRNILSTSVVDYAVLTSAGRAAFASESQAVSA